MDGFQATRADHLQPGVQLPCYTDLPFHEFCSRAHLESLHLSKVAGTVVNRSRGVALPDANFADCQLFYV